MKTGIFLAAAVALTAAPALAQSTQPAPQTQAQPPAVQSVTVIDISELPAASKQQVERIEEQRTDEELKNLHASIEASPPLVDAIEARGASLADVVAASLSQAGVLTIVTRKES